MKRNILSVCMLALLCLLSCDMNALNDLLNEVREKVLDESKDNKYLNHEQGNQEQKEVVIDSLEEGVEIQQDMEVKPVNAGFEVFRQEYPYYPQEEVIKIEEKDLVPSTESEKEAQAEIEKVKGALGDSGFQQLIKNALELKDRCERGRADFYDIMGKIQSERISLTKKRKENIEKIRKLTQLQNKLNDERSNLERLMNEVEVGLNERSSAKYFFEDSEKILKEAITDRLRNNKRRSYWSRRGNGDFLARKARSNAESSLEQLESSSVKLIEAMAKIKEIEELISEAKSALGNLSR
ncbi:P12 family lipoprotein [Borrelia puertoricensis]|uniref:P12 family lipoprotein n=1 Tax=Borrelia puertoricensis TaxID=2756107 RepID=UPI001FF1EEF3|nr:P12 family lipoprotein [Borrelia puertoricensis]UPA19160.1 P12 family lipoprotein [Borrelia puertoricensis]UPA19204.1 P12 family lipoprotein [Borrelia puertoricensis]UPA19273.1 P12 family lipoprotein [Borrelia puertoricensis]UPA19303.1 P12 family lipoprotein [Borrelia puertoricensis]UPA19349.1 P12 family lipoprotein [Borrelia puertoricensis]